MSIPVVYDCMIFLQAVARPNNPANACLNLAETGRVGLFVSDEILFETKGVLARPKIRKKFPRITDDRVNQLLSWVAEFATCSSDIPEQFELPRDPKNAKYLNLAAFVRAAYLVSRDNDLLESKIDDSILGRTLREQYPGLQIIDPVAFLRLIDSSLTKDAPGT